MRLIQLQLQQKQSCLNIKVRLFCNVKQLKRAVIVDTPKTFLFQTDENDSDSDEFERLHVMMKKQKSNTATATQSRPTRQRRKASTSIKFKFEDESDVSEEVDESSDFVPSAEEAAVSSSDEDEEARRSKPRADASLTPSNLQGNPTKSVSFATN